jgi:hypothetical protein
MSSVQRARHRLYAKSATTSFVRSNDPQWRGSETWLDIFFNRSLMVFGISLYEEEVFLRWLLIERSKRHKAIKTTNVQSYYVCRLSHDPQDLKRNYFLRQIGFDILEVGEYPEIYESQFWQT